MVKEVVEAAIKKGIQIITITDHAPFPVDIKNRLLECELENYIEEIEDAKSKFYGKIEILVGLEVDFLRLYESYVVKLLKNLNLDYVLGAIHYIFIDGERVNVWDIHRTGDSKIINLYFDEFKALIQTGLFDATAHPDILLRSGLDECVFFEKFLPLLDVFSNRGLAYELNASGFTKPSYDKTRNCINYGVRTYPSPLLMNEINKRGIKVVLGSDSHSIDYVGKNIPELIKECKSIGLRNIVYFKNRIAKRLDFDI